MLWCPLRFPHKTMLGSSSPSVVCRGRVFSLRYMYLFAHSGVQNILCCVFVLFVFVLLLVSLDCPFLIASSVFSNVYLRDMK